VTGPSFPGPPVAFGSTGTDLSSTGPAAFRASVRRGTGRSVAIAVGALVALVALSGGIYLARGGGASRAAAAQAEAGPPPSAFTPVPMSASTTATVASAGGGTSAAPVDSTAPPGGASAARKIRRPKPGAGHGAPPGAPDLDSRF
jgi:hypothetical protein